MIEVTRPSDPTPLAEMAAAIQRQPAGHVVYCSTDADAIAKEIADVDRWTEMTRVAHLDGRPVGWLLAETDLDMGRVWWWGPFVAGGVDWQAVAGALYDELRPALEADIGEEELAADERHVEMARFAERRRFTAETASAVLTCHGRPPAPTHPPEPMTPGDAAVAALHDRLFPRTHTPGHLLVAGSGPESVRLVARDGATPVGYIAAEVQAEGGYIDFVGVEPSARGRGVGADLVSAATNAMFDAGVEAVHLTVRETNGTARRLYARLGFAEERIVRPYRKGFSLDRW